MTALNRLLARLTTPLTYLMWVLIAVGLADHFFGPVLPPVLVEIGFYGLWIVAAATWFGFRQRKRDDAAGRGQG